MAVPALISVTGAAQIHQCPQLRALLFWEILQPTAVLGWVCAHPTQSRTFTAGSGTSGDLRNTYPRVKHQKYTPKGKTPRQETSGFYLYAFESRVFFGGLTQTPFNTKTEQYQIKEVTNALKIINIENLTARKK